LPLPTDSTTTKTMKFVSYQHKGNQDWGLFNSKTQFVYSLKEKSPSLIDYINSQKFNSELSELKKFEDQANLPASELEFLACLPKPGSCRDAYAFRQHVAAARKNRGVPMIPEYDEFPVFYFTNHRNITGPGPVPVRDCHLEKLDFELEVAIVIGKECKDVKAENADEYIFGYTIYNDWSARSVQMKEMKLNMGPMKGKDFANSFGAWLVTKEELEEKLIKGPNGDQYDLNMSATINGEKISNGNTKDMTWTFAQIIERASYSCTLAPGDIIGSGTVGTGCYLELNGSKVTNRWLENGDEVILEIDGLGSLKNTVLREADV